MPSQSESPSAYDICMIMFQVVALKELDHVGVVVTAL
jgi:hypothetical protein